MGLPDDPKRQGGQLSFPFSEIAAAAGLRARELQIRDEVEENVFSLPHGIRASAKEKFGRVVCDFGLNSAANTGEQFASKRLFAQGLRFAGQSHG